MDQLWWGPAVQWTVWGILMALVVSRLMGKLRRRSSGSPPFVPVAVLLLPQDPSRSYRGGAGIADE